ncbi:MAG: 16S rRNA (adenine(1518)-N(6)/adenine(1519)-N(6))-dimethyltransferase, partial [Bacteroidia bacterium]|nr:16S rRNA (adenine(1518)-N(6)/adenine(1519)-N(6))-dimethyltransferase [Bacteroidia bacterium]
FNLVGNFPYNISSQIIFKMIENVEMIPKMIGMFQKEVAERICAGPGGKTNGILSVRAQAFYKAEKIFDIPPEAFSPPPKVNSSVIVLTRKENYQLPCDEKLFSRIIKTGFQQRRKKLRNTLKSIFDNTEDPIFQKRPEELTVEDFVNLTLIAQKQK